MDNISTTSNISPKNLSNSNLISLYAIFHNLQRDVSGAIYKLIAIFFNANFLTLGGSIIIYTAMDSSVFKNICIVLCGSLLIALSITFIKMTGKVYYNQLECIAQCGQIEDLLDFNNSEHYSGTHYFKNEGLMINRHLNNRANTKDKNGENTKQAFVEKYSTKGQRRFIKANAYIFILFGILLIASVVLSFTFHIQI